MRRARAALPDGCVERGQTTRSTSIRFLAANRASGNLKTRRRPCNFSATECRAAEKCTGYRRRSVESSQHNLWRTTGAARSGRFFAKHARGASGILKTRSRPGNFSATGCRAAEKYTRSRRRPKRALSVFSLCLLAWHIFPWRRHLVQFFSAAAAQVTANWLKPLKFPGCAARTRRIEQPELPSNDRSCVGHAFSCSPRRQFPDGMYF